MESYDMLYGRPPLALQKKMRTVTERILGMDSWTAFFRMIGFPMSPQETGLRVTSLLRTAWKRSLQKGYHKKVQLVLPQSYGYTSMQKSSVVLSSRSCSKDSPINAIHDL